MPRERLTEKRLRDLARNPPERRAEYYDATFGEGSGQLILRHEVSGRLYWSFLYYVPERVEGGKRVRRRLNIGRYPRFSLAEAQRKAGEWEAAVEAGRDPGQARHGERSFSDLWTEYLERYAKREKRSWRQDKSLAERHLIRRRLNPKGPRFGDLPVEAITRHDVSVLLDAIMDEGYGRTANRVKSLLSSVFAFGADRGWVERSPLVGMRQPARLAARDRVLADEEIGAFWRACRGQESIRRRCGLPLVLVTAQRPGEVLTLQREDVDLDAGLWRLPRTKSNREHLVPLSPLALRLFREAFADPFSPEYPFLRREPAAHRNPTFPVAEVDQVRAAMEGELGVESQRWVPHDLRRTAYSGMTGLGIPRFPVVEAVVNHAVPGVAGVYDRHDYLAPKTDALMRWADHLEDLFAGRRHDNVVALTRSARES